MADNIQTSYDLSSLAMPGGSPYVTATALTTGLTESERSNSVQYTSEYLKFKLLSNNTYSIAGMSENYTGITHVRIPSEYEKIPVTEISSNAFKGNATIEKIIISPSITQIGGSAFEDCTKLTAIEFEQDSYYTIFFRNTQPWTDIRCSEKHNGTWKYGETGLAMELYEEKNDGNDIYKIRVLKSTLDSIKFSGVNSAGVREFTLEIKSYNVGDYCCWQTHGGFDNVLLYEGFMPTGLTFNSKAFKNSGIQKITIPNSVGAINSNVFENCTSLKSVSFHTLFKVIGTSAFAGCSSLENIAIPSGVHTIGRYAFKQSGLKTVTIPKTVTDIGEGAFANCVGLAVASIGCSGTIQDYAFSGCTFLTIVTFENGNRITSIGRYAFQGTMITSIAIPASVTWIGLKAFWGIKALNHATFEDETGWAHTTADGKYNGTLINLNKYVTETLTASEALAKFFTEASTFDTKSWYKFEQMVAPTISLTGTILTITDSTGFAESFKIYINDDKDCIAHIDVNGNLITA